MVQRRSDTPHLLDAAIVVVGDEVLDGFVEEANAAWLSQRLQELGIPLERIAVVRDDVDAIRAELELALAGDRPRVVFTSGGIGGTWDDVTYQAVAEVQGVGLEDSPALLEPVQRIIDWAADHGYEFDEDAVNGMRRIAAIPAGAEVLQLKTFLAAVHAPLDGGIDAPGGAAVVVLPGPPGHLRALFDQLIVPRLLAGRGSEYGTVTVEHAYPETLLVGALGRIRRNHPEVTAGSYPGDPMVVRFRGPATAIQQASDELRAFLADLDRHPSAALIREAWTQQAAGWEA